MNVYDVCVCGMCELANVLLCDDSIDFGFIEAFQHMNKLQNILYVNDDGIHLLSGVKANTILHHTQNGYG